MLFRFSPLRDDTLPYFGNGGNGRETETYIISLAYTQHMMVVYDVRISHMIYIYVIIITFVCIYIVYKRTEA